MAMIDRRVLACLVVLLVNDWWLKAAFPGWVTGKLSDFSGIVVFAAAISTVLLWSGARRRTAAYLGALLAGTALAMVKVSAAAATAVVAVLEATTGVGHTIVVDNSDLLALLALPVAVLAIERPRPPTFFDQRRGKRVRLTLFALACVACAASSVDERPSLTHIETNESGEVIVGRSEFDDTVTAVMAIDADGNVDRSLVDAAVEWSLTTQSCSPIDDRVCLSVGPETAINESTDGGESFDEVWAIDDGGWWHDERNTEATDIEWLPDGTAFVAMTSMDPIKRSVDGSFSPSIASLHPYPIVVIGFALLGWLIAAESAFFSGRRSTAGTVVFAVAAFAALGGALIAMLKGFGPGLAIILGLPAIAACLIAGYIIVAVQRKEDQRTGVTPSSIGRAPWWAFIWPVPLIVLAGAAWDADLVPWLVTVVIVFGSILVGWPLLWVLRPKADELRL